MPERFDLVVIGGGPGGHAAAEHAARRGARVAAIERDGWGGTCTHRGCIPTKTLLACSGAYAARKRWKRLGIETGEVAFDFAAMKRHQKQIVSLSSLGAQKTLKDAGVSLLQGTGILTAPDEVSFAAPDGKDARLCADRILIAWGSEPALLPGIPLSERILTSDGFLALETLPKSVAIVGGSVIGVEFATFLAELGVRVILIEMLERLLPAEEGEASVLLRKELAGLGVEIHTAARLESLCETASGVVLTASSPGGLFERTAEYALVCTGRKPVIHAEELGRLGIAHDRKGIAVDERQETGVKGIFAVGDVTGGMMLAHRAMQQGKALADRLFGDGSLAYDERWVPSVAYSHPQVARVGMTEREARERGLAVEVRRADYAAGIMARIELRGPGFVKALFHRDRLVGATVAGEGACELIAPLGLALSRGLDLKALRQWILPHPTLSEILASLG
jgi:dihydrolipoamide dehydrogenase